MTLERFDEWVRKNYPIDQYDNVFDLMRDVEQRVNGDGHDLNDNVKQLLLDKFAPDFDPRYRELLQRREDQQQAADMLGSGKIMQSITDEIVESLNNPRSEIMDIDMTEYATTRETVVPPEIRNFYQTRQTFFGRIASTFRRVLFRR